MLYRIQVTRAAATSPSWRKARWSTSGPTTGCRMAASDSFANRGERARLRWVEVSHQYDALGRVCAYLAPYGIEGRNGNIN
jgi:hypothetical protein